MKNNYLIITSFLLIFFSTKIAAQGTLQFNQVITQNLSAPYTVPAGKVFKLEAVTCTSGGSMLTAGPLIMYPISNQTNVGGNSSQSWAWPFPIWLKAGDIISYGAGSSAAISGIEFNIIP